MSEQLRNPGQDPSLLGGNIVEETYPRLADFGLGEGNFGEGVEISPQLAEVFQRITNGDFDIPTTDRVAVSCIDDRLDADGNRIDAPSSAAGTIGLTYARDMGGVTFLSDATESNLIVDTVNSLKAQNDRVCVHGDDHGSCGCGAVKEAEAIHEITANEITKINAAASALGLPINPENQEVITARASHRKQQGNNYFEEDRANSLKCATDCGAEYEQVVGEHLGVAVVWRGEDRAGTRLDKSAIYKEYGIEVFTVDAWTFNETAKHLAYSGSDEEIARIESALVAWNIATGSKLCSDEMIVLPV